MDGLASEQNAALQLIYTPDYMYMCMSYPGALVSWAFDFLCLPFFEFCVQLR